MSETKDWRSPTLNIGQSMSCQKDDAWLSIDHVDRRIDPYLAGVIKGGRIVYSGLHSTLASARAALAKKAGE